MYMSVRLRDNYMRNRKLHSNHGYYVDCSTTCIDLRATFKSITSSVVTDIFDAIKTDYHWSKDCSELNQT